MDAATSAALIATIPARTNALTGLIRRFKDEKNQPAVQTAEALAQFTVHAASQHLQQLSDCTNVPDHFAEIRQHARDALAAVSATQTPSVATPEQPVATPPDS